MLNFFKLLSTVMAERRLESVVTVYRFHREVFFAIRRLSIDSGLGSGTLVLGGLR